MNRVIRFFHEFMNPHCEHCVEERLEAAHCKSCEILAVQNSQLVRENERLLDIITEKYEPATIPAVIEDAEPIRKHIPWNVRKQQLETEKLADLRAKQNAALPDSVFNKSAEEKFLKELNNG